MSSPCLVKIYGFILKRLGLGRGGCRETLFCCRRTCRGCRTTGGAGRRIDTGATVTTICCVRGSGSGTLQSCQRTLGLSRRFKCRSFRICYLHYLVKVLSGGNMAGRACGCMNHFLRLSSSLSPGSCYILKRCCLHVGGPSDTRCCLGTTVSTGVNKPHRGSTTTGVLLTRACAVGTSCQTTCSVRGRYLTLYSSVRLDCVGGSTTRARLQCGGRHLRFRHCHSDMERGMVCVVTLMSIVTVYNVVCVFHHEGGVRGREVRRCLALVRRLGGAGLRVPSTTGVDRLLGAHFRILGRLTGACCRFRGSPTLAGGIGNVLSRGVLSGAVVSSLRGALGRRCSGIVSGFGSRCPGVGPYFIRLLYLLCTKFSPRRVDIVAGRALGAVCVQGFRLGGGVVTSDVAAGGTVLGVVSWVPRGWCFDGRAYLGREFATGILVWGTLGRDPGARGFSTFLYTWLFIFRSGSLYN